VSIVANFHCIKLIIHIPLKSADHSFTLYKIIILPERVSPDKFVQYAIDNPNLAVQVSQHGYIPFTEKDYSKCVTISITVCALDSAILIHKDLPVLLVYSSRVQTAKNYVRETSFSTINNQR